MNKNKNGIQKLESKAWINYDEQNHEWKYKLRKSNNKYSNIYNYATNDEISNKYISKLFKIRGELRRALCENEENENSNKHKEID